MSKHVIYGPPGTGKSTEVIRRLKEYLDNGVPHDRIGLCSFTKTSAEVLSRRSGLKNRAVGTIHSLAFRQSGIIREQVMDANRLRDFADSIALDLAEVTPDEKEELQDGDYYITLYSKVKALNHNDYESVYEDSEQPGSLEDFLYFVKKYEAFKSDNGYVDYNDMLTLALTADPLELDVLFIDEAQDLSPLQWALIDYWIPTIEHVHVSGDDDQSIYDWGGADPFGMTVFEEKYNAIKTVLSQSFRVPSDVHNKALSILQNIGDRVDKPYKPRDAKGSIHYHESADMIGDFTKGESVLILYRNHVLREEMEAHLIDSFIPYVVDNGAPGYLDGWYRRLIKLYAKYIDKGSDDSFSRTDSMQFRSALHPMCRVNVKEGDYSKLQGMHWSDALDMPVEPREYLLAIEKEYGTLDIEPDIHLSSIHGAKGREADRVILINALTLRTSDTLDESDDLDSEARVFYVAVTRTKNRLDIIDGDNALTWL
tara:strand:- start:1189 stop:2637 length:1449 start_codon:yes stop_codon:yes gene_type:complete